MLIFIGTKSLYSRTGESVMDKWMNEASGSAEAETF